MRVVSPKTSYPWILSGIFLFLVITTISLGYYFYNTQREHMKLEKHEDLSAIAELKVRQIIHWREERIGDAEVIYETPTFAYQVAAFLKTPNDKKKKQGLYIWLKALKDHYSYRDVCLMDAQGMLRLSVPTQSTSPGMHIKEQIKEVLRSRKIFFSDLYASEITPNIYIDILIPLRLPDEQSEPIIGIVLLRIDPSKLLFPIIQSWPTPSLTSETQLLERQGDSVVYLNELRHLKNTVLTFRLPVSNEKQLAAMGARGIEGTVEGLDYRNIPVLAAVKKIPNSSWFLIAKVDQEEIYAPLRTQTRLIGTIMILFLFFITTAIGFWWRHQRAQFYRKHYEAEVERQALIKHFDYFLKYVNDIVILADEYLNIQEVNNRAVETYGYSQEELLHLKLEYLRPSDNVEDLWDRIKAINEQGGARYETIHRKKDGTTFPIEASIRLIEIEGKKYYQAIIRDITERKRAEEILRKSEERYQTVFENTGTATVLIEENTIISLVNVEFEKLSQYSKQEIEGKKSWTEFILLEDLERMRTQHMLRRERPEEALKQYEFRIINKNGDVRDILLSIDIIHGTKQSIASLLDITDRKRAEEELRESEKRYRSLVEVSPDTVAVHANGKIVYVNPAAIKLLQAHDNTELIGKPVIDVVHPDYKELVRERVIGAMEHGKAQPLTEEKFVCLDGTVVDVEAVSVPITFEGMNAILVIARNITDRKQTEEALAQSETKYRSLIETTDTGFVILDGKGQVLDANKEYIRLTGHDTLQQILGRCVTEWTAEHDRAKNAEQVEMCIEQGFVRNLEIDYVDKRGRFTPVEINATVVNTAGNIVIVTLCRNITERKKIDEALLQSNSFNERLIQTMPFGMDIVDEKGTILFISDFMKELLGADALGQSCWTMYKDNKKQCHNCPLIKGIEFGRADIIESSGVLGGKTFQISHTGILYQGKKAMLEVFQDVTEQKKLQLELLQIQKMESIGTLAGGVAHDFNNILAIVLAYTTALERSADDKIKISEYCHTISQAVSRGAALVRQILTFARKADLVLVPINVADLIDEIISMLKRTFPKVITFKESIENDIPFINADRTQIHQTMLNLCVNARDAMPNGGSITIKAEKQTKEFVQERIPAADQDSYVCISIIDTGEGMTEATLRRIFDPFFTTKEPGKGTGLGLSVVYGVVQSHHGFIDVESSVGNGTTFRLYFPISLMSEQIIDTPVVMESFNIGGTETILLVEDEEALLKMVQLMLESKGYKVFTAQNGSSAIEIYKTNKKEIDIVLTDMGLPEMTGMDVFKKIKQINPSVKTIFASGFFEPEIKTELIKEGAEEFIQKPYSQDEVLRKLRELLDAKNA